jgi:hypothetical protein
MKLLPSLKWSMNRTGVPPGAYGSSGYHFLFSRLELRGHR